MKKIISMTLVVSLLILCLSGCSVLDKINAFIGNDDGKDCPDAGDSANTPTEDEKEPGVPLDADSDIVVNIITFIEKTRNPEFIVGVSAKPYAKIRTMKLYEAQLYEITFDSSEFYFVGGYTTTPLNEHGWLWEHLVATECHWFKFNSADDIPEYINDEKCTFVFQFNKAASIINLLKNDKMLTMDHFLEYEPEFKNGFNARPAVTFDEKIFWIDTIDFLTLVDYSSDKTYYYSTSSPYSPWNEWRTVEIDGKRYIKFYSRSIYANGSEEKVDASRYLGTHTEDFLDIIEYDKYVEGPDSQGYTLYCSCIEIYSFINVLNEKILPSACDCESE